LRLVDSAETTAATCVSSAIDNVEINVVGVSLTGSKEKAAAAPQLMWNFSRIPT
jgi:1-aminocyclopropane-1-carboxylate deaminase/D-cysteine desulfhydrase-like pyridoxal-dependent ACC family enzyme